MTGHELLAEARALAEQGEGELGTTAVRGSALLGHATLEEGIFAMYPSLREVSGRAMLLVLPMFWERQQAPPCRVPDRRTIAYRHR